MFFFVITGVNGNQLFHYKYIPCGEGYDLCLELNFHCKRNNFKKVANMKEESKCSFRGLVDSGEAIFVSSKNCTIDKKEWKLEVIKYNMYKYIFVQHLFVSLSLHDIYTNPL